LSTFSPTQEQEQILASFKKGKNIKVHAFAGTGKTRTLGYLAESTSKKGLYVAFNKRVASEAKKKMPKNVTASTIHSLAWKWAQEQFPKEKLIKSPNRTLLSKFNDIPNVSGFSEYKTLTTISLMLGDFCNSRDPQVNTSHLPWNHISYINEQEVLKRSSKSLLAAAQSAWLKMCDAEHELPLGHSGYLKFWSMNSPNLNYDFILVDEAQDLSPVMLEILDNFNGQKVLVGDSHQQIYSWRGAVDAMKYELAAESHHLTLTFRFGEELSKLANRVLRSLAASKSMKSHTALGTKVDTKGKDVIDAYIFRKNSSLIQKAVEFFEKENTFHIVDPNKNISQSVDDYFRLNEGLWGKSQAFEGFNSWDSVVAIAKKEETNPFRGFVDLFENNDPDLIRKAINSSQKKESSEYPTLTTGHQAKGMEWDKVCLSDDFTFSSESLHKDQTEEELRLLYVSMTRAKGILSLPPELHEFCQTTLGQSSQKYAIVDLETTGLDPSHGHRITEIGIAIWQNGKIVDRYQSLINPQRKIPAFVQDLTGITDAMVRKARPSREVLLEAMGFIGDMPLVAHNASFERKFLNAELEEISEKYSVDLICSLLLSRRVFPNLSGYKLGDLVSNFKLPKGQAHRALSDAEMTAHLFSKIKNTLEDELEDDFVLSSDNLIRITKNSPKAFRENGISKAYLQALKKFNKVRYASYDFTTENLPSVKNSYAHAETKVRIKKKRENKSRETKKGDTPTAHSQTRLEYSKARDFSDNNIPIKKRSWIKWLVILTIVFFTVRFCSNLPSPSQEFDVIPESAVEKKTIGIVTARQLRHRACPDIECDVVGGSLEGARLVILEERNGWYRVLPENESNDIAQQWVSAGYVKPSDDTGG
jgi:DNA polymerase III epsilon subunit family exonuclease